MKHAKRLLVMMLCLVMGMTSLTAQAAEKKEGLQKKGGEYYFYAYDEDGELTKVTNTWKTVDGDKYYFGDDGKAYRAKSDSKNKYNVVTKTIGGTKYGFDVKARLAKGVYVKESDEKLYYYNSKGKYSSKKTKTLQNDAKSAKKYFTKYAAGGKKVKTATLKKSQKALDTLLKDLKKRGATYKRREGKAQTSCIAALSDGTRYTDVTYTFDHFKMTAVIYPGTSYEILYDIYTI